MPSLDRQELEQKVGLMMGYVVEQLERGKSHEQIEADLVDKGLPDELAQELIRHTAELHDTKPQNTQLLQKATAASRGRTRMGRGFAFLFIGALITGATYLFADPGGTYLICWGAMAVGVIYFILGLVEWMTNAI